MEYILWIILWVIVAYLTIGVIAASYTMFSLWNIGHFELPREKRHNPIWAFFKVAILWGTIFFEKKRNV